MRQLPERHPFPLHDTAATRQIEAAIAGRLPPHTLMARAGLATARLALALFPHAQRIWVACGPGNNGGDALVAACHLARWRRERGVGPQVHVSRCDSATPPPDTAWALRQAIEHGLVIHDNPPDRWDAAIDGLLGLGASRAPAGLMGEHWRALFNNDVPILCVDLPSGLNADTGHWLRPPDMGTPSPRNPPSRHTLTMLTAKPGLFTADGRDAAGTVWLTMLDDGDHPITELCPAVAMLVGVEQMRAVRPHTAHKGSQGDVIVIGGQGMSVDDSGMTGAAILAARAALHAGAGRVYLGLLGEPGQDPSWDMLQPELMFRRPRQLVTGSRSDATVTVCGCGGGSAVQEWLAPLLHEASTLVLDADALNALAADAKLLMQLSRRASQDKVSVITPHPLEAARLLGCSTADVQNDRLRCAQELTRRTQAICVLKGSGTVVTAPGEIPYVNASGNPALAAPGTGDVLAGLIASLLAQGLAGKINPLDSVVQAVYRHGFVADQLSPYGSGRVITAYGLTSRLGCD